MNTWPFPPPTGPVPWTPAQERAYQRKQIEALKLALEKAFDLGKRYWSWADSEYSSHWKKADAAKEQFNQLVEDTIREALAEQPAQQQEPVAWMPIEQMYPQAKAIDILMGDGSILCAVLPQFDGDLWWEGSGTGEKFIDPKYADVTHWRIHNERTSPQPAQHSASVLEQNTSNSLETTNQEAQDEPVAHSIVAGALFDFMGWLTSRRERLALSSTDDAAPAADAIKDFAHMRSLSINDAKVQEWQKHLAAPPPRKSLTDEQIQTIAFEAVKENWDWLRFARAIEAAHGITGEQK